MNPTHWKALLWVQLSHVHLPSQHMEKGTLSTREFTTYLSAAEIFNMGQRGMYQHRVRAASSMLHIIHAWRGPDLLAPAGQTCDTRSWYHTQKSFGPAFEGDFKSVWLRSGQPWLWQVIMVCSFPAKITDTSFIA